MAYKEVPFVMKKISPSPEVKRVKASEPFHFKAEGKLLKGEISHNHLQLIISEMPDKEILRINTSSPITGAFTRSDGSSVICLHGESLPAEFFCTKTGKSLSPQHFQKNG
jgi:hypothetical protein